MLETSNIIMIKKDTTNTWTQCQWTCWYGVRY